jgi:16S rRNA (guanine527-N7)-methyltransferase
MGVNGTRVEMDELIAGAAKLGIELTPEQVSSFEMYYRQLVEWNRRVNLTAIVEYEGVQVKHFLDSLTVAPLIGDHPSRLIDIGSGAGFPGVPLKIACPGIDLTLVESVNKKAAFLHHLVDRLKLDRLEVVAGRAETLAHDERYREQFDIAICRAVAGLATLAELSLPFCAVGGRFIAMKKGGIGDEVASSEKAIDMLGGKLAGVRPVELDEFGGDERSLVIIDKLSPTSDKYPRRPGIPRKRPL